MAAPKLRLYHYWRSSSSWRVRWALAVKGLQVEYVATDLLGGELESPEHLARNPLGFVPVLELVGAPEGHRYLTESLAIMEWLEETHPRPSILPSDPYLRARARQLAEVVNAGTQPLQNLNAQELHSADPAEKKRWAQHWIRNGLQAYEKLARETAGRFSVGDSLSIADFCLVPQCYNAARNEVALDAYPTIKRIHAAALETESYRVSEPERFKPEGFKG